MRKVLARKQIVGDGCGYAIVRDLIEFTGKRISVPLSHPFSCRETRRMTTEAILAAHRLP